MSTHSRFDQCHAIEQKLLIIPRPAPVKIEPRALSSYKRPFKYLDYQFRPYWSIPGNKLTKMIIYIILHLILPECCLSKQTLGK